MLSDLLLLHLPVAQKLCGVLPHGIYILWEQENCYRPNFQVVQEEVLMPVLLAKVSGVKDGNVQSYWNDIFILYFFV